MGKYDQRDSSSYSKMYGMQQGGYSGQKAGLQGDPIYQAVASRMGKIKSFFSPDDIQKKKQNERSE